LISSVVGEDGLECEYILGIATTEELKKVHRDMMHNQLLLGRQYIREGGMKLC